MKNTFKKYSFRFLVCALHALLLMIVVWVWIGLYWNYGEEMTVVKRGEWFKRAILPEYDKPDSNDYVFIDLAYDKELIPRPDGPGEIVISDRKKLADLFRIISKYPGQYKFIFCDVLFDYDSPNDSLLNEYITKVPKLVVAAGFEDTILLKPKFRVPYALVDYTEVNDAFSKFWIMSNDSISSVPVHIHQNLSAVKYNRSNFFYYMNQEPVLQAIIPDFRIRNYDLEHNKYLTLALNEALIIPDDSLVFYSYLKDKYIFIGDFKEDVHKTIFGRMPGTLIVANVLLSLQHGDHILNKAWLMYLFWAFVLLSWLVFYPVKFGKRMENFLKTPFWKYFGQGFSIFSYLSIVSFVSYFFFHVIVNILIVGGIFLFEALILRSIKQAPTKIRTILKRGIRGNIKYLFTPNQSAV